MELKAKPRNQEDSSFFKFAEIGDSIEGVFVRYEPIAGQYEKPEIQLRTKTGIKTVGCSKKLQEIIEDNQDKLPGQVVKITFIGTQAIKGRAQPMKLYKVDVRPPKTNAPEPAPDAVDPDDSDIPF